MRQKHANLPRAQSVKSKKYMFLKLNMIEIQNRAMANTAFKMAIEKDKMLYYNIIKSKQAWADPENFVRGWGS